MAERRVYLSFFDDALTKPLIWEMGHKHKVVTNIRNASIKNDMGLVALGLEGDDQEIDRALEWIAEQGVKVEPIEKNVIE